MEPLEHLLARDLGGEEPQGRVGDLVGGIEPGAGRHGAGQHLQEPLHPVAAQGREHEGVVEGEPRVGRLGEFQQRLDRHGVDLVQHQEAPRLAFRHAAQDGVVLGVEAAAGVDQQRHGVRVARPAPGGLHHGAVETAPRREDPGRVDEDHLGVAPHRDAPHRRPRGLDLARHDRHFRAHEGVDEGRLPGVGRPDQRREAAARAFGRGGVGLAHRDCPSAGEGGSGAKPSRCMKPEAAACSAWRFEGPSPSAGAQPSTVTVTVKRGAWSGPLRSVSL